MKTIEVATPSQAVLIGGDIEAIIEQVCIGRDLAVSYRVIWWDGKTRKAEWLNSRELQPAGELKMQRIGFNGKPSACSAACGN